MLTVDISQFILLHAVLPPTITHAVNGAMVTATDQSEAVERMTSVITWQQCLEAAAAADRIAVIQSSISRRLSAHKSRLRVGVIT